MAPRTHSIVLGAGDVLALQVIHQPDHTRLVVHHEDREAPLIQAVLSLSECQALIEALCPQPAFGHSAARRPFRQLRPLNS